MYAEPSSSSLGPYWLASRLATGDRAEVYLGRRVEADGRVGPLVLVRRLLPHLAAHPEAVARLLEEAGLAAGLAHPHVASVLEAGVDGGEAYVALPLLEGCTVAALLAHAEAAGRPLPLGLALRVVADACRGLSALHRAAGAAGRSQLGVPRALTPHGVHLSRRGEVRVLELGTVLLPPDGGEAVRPFAAPEVRAGDAVDARADVFSAGALLDALLAAGRRGPHPDWRQSSLLPQALAQLLEAALAPARGERPADLEVLGAALEAAAAGLEPVGPEGLAAHVEALRRPPEEAPRPAEAPVVLPAPPPPAPRWWTQAPFVAALVVALHVAVAVYALWPERSVSERLAVAARARERAVREEELAPLAGDADASPADLKEAARLLLEVDGYVTLQALAEALEARAPGDVEALLLQARASTALRMGRRAEEVLARAARLAPDDVRPALALADLREQQGDLHAALQALAPAHARGAGPAVSLRYGVLLSQAGRLTEAEGVLGRLAEEGGAGPAEDGTALAELAFVRYRQSRFEEARALLARAVHQAPQRALAHYYLGAVLFRLKDTAGAERAWREADRLQPDDVRALAALCELVGRSGRAEASLALAQELRRRFPAQLATLHPACLTP